MPKFKVGDQVRFTGKRWFNTDEIVTIIEVDPEDTYCTYKCSDGVNNCWVCNENVEPIFKFEVGQIYRVDLKDSREFRNIVKIISINDDSDFEVEYKTIKGNPGECTKFGAGSLFSDSLVLLTGPQIGEAIKKYDADHAEKKTEDSSEYTEVKRPAQIGEKIKIVNASAVHHGYKNGDILTVSKTYSDAVYAENTCGILNREYVVLEPKSSVKEVKRPAKPGEYIKLVVKSFSFNHVGDILRMGEDGSHILGKDHPYKTAIDEEPWCYLPFEYVVLEGYSPVKEVKRHAKVGEYIRLTAADSVTRGKHSNGDVLEVTKEHGRDSVFVNRESVGCVRDCEYVVLEDYKPENAKDEKRTAKIGEMVKALKDEGGFIFAGKVYKVDSVLSDGTVMTHDPAGRWTCTNSITHYVIVNGGKHSYTAAEILEAKSFVLDTIRDLAEQGKYVLFDAIGHANDNHMAYVGAKGSTTRFDGENLTICDVKTGESNCSPNDEPNEWIGKCVALCKALHKPIPAFIMGN